MTQANTPSTEAAATAVATFADCGLHPDLQKAVAETGYTVPTPIQAQAIPVVMNGRDVMGAAQTGTGKTAAFTLPILHRLMPLANNSMSPARHPVRALILAPTRELADQVADNARKYSLHSPLRTAVVFGGVDIGPQKLALRNGCEVLIATPGRLLDHVEQRNVNLGQVGILVLDEADRMLDMGFLPDLERIIRLLPQQRQTLLFSATFSNEIRKLARSYLHDPVEIAVAGRNATADTVTQIAYPLAPEAKRAAVVHLVKSRGLKQVIVFSNTKIGTGRLARELERDGVRAESIHGDKTQGDRMKALEAFKAGELEVLVATDVAARGLDVAGVPCVINYDLPYSAEDYVHRIGRTGRAGASGEAIALFSPNEEKLLVEIEKLIKRPVPRGSLDLPVEASSRSRHDSRGEGRGSRPERSERPERGASRSAGSGRGSSAPRQPVDEFFSKPYEPSAAPSGDSQASAPAANPSRAPARRALGVLLGGGPRKSDE
ncbi:DEAD/DEAH box helicase [Orrella dioscoreae]|uniref:DEAD-box ATP-dependent RNA helicase RhpA n=2 Tax=root TaxID=1 RepID=A0A1C3K3L7_9BURK|nr:DEAD/DEAH box helicase [Orrella dioscoreae]SBT26090.1 ATP-dependent RNA helicase Bcep18194_A5658 [Orrella dioscoreae]SOE47854.1 ATP-dependent RNA helicase Bcep18194_A5658 [Orrella dioscoreae]